MRSVEPDFLTKLKWSLPWLSHYPLWRGDGAALFRRERRDGRFKIHFATAREAFNIAMAAVEGRDGDPNIYRDYRLIPIRKKTLGGS